MIKVSIIVPVYNIAKYLERCLDSIINQSLKDIEIICINDGSTDNSEDILCEYAQKDNRIKIINQVNSGICVARNTGVKAATGEFIGYVDSDDYIDPNFYKRLYEAAKRNSADIACGSIVRIIGKKKKVLINYNSIDISDTVKGKFEIARVPEHCYVWNKIYNREKLINSGVEFISGAVYEDMDYTPAVLEKLEVLVSVPNAKYYYWKRPNSLTQNDSDKSRADKLAFKPELIEKCKKYNVSLRKKDYVLSKQEFYILGIKVLKIYKYRATNRYYLFGLIPFLTVREYV